MDNDPKPDDGVDASRDGPEAVIEATVLEVRDFGLIVEASGGRGVITSPEVSWLPVPDLGAIYTAGDRVRCLVLRTFPEDTFGQTFTASIRAADPDGNPWRDPSAYHVGEVFTAEVDLIVDYGFWLPHPRGARVLVRNEDAGDSPAIAARLTVRVTGVLLDREYLTAVPVNPSSATRPTPR